MRLYVGTASVAMLLLVSGALLLWFVQSRANAQDAEQAAVAEPVADEANHAAKRSVTVFPVNVKPGKNVTLQMRATLATSVGVFLERAGLKNVELAGSEFIPPQSDDAKQIAQAFAEYIRENPPNTQYALFAQFVGTPKTGPKAIVTVLVDRSGKILLAERDTPGVFASLLRTWPKCPLECSLLAARRVQRFWGLANPLRPDAPTDGKMDMLLGKQSTIPPKAELEAMEKRLDALKNSLKKEVKPSSLTVYPIHLAAGAAPGCTEELVEAINSRGLFQAVAGRVGPDIKVEGSFNEQRVLWAAARAFRYFLRKTPPQSEYALYADYGICVPSAKQSTGQRREASAVHLILCNRHGEWVLVDFQNSHHRDFQKIKPATCEDCNRLAVERLTAQLRE